MSQLLAPINVLPARDTGLKVAEFSVPLRAALSGFREVAGDNGPEGVADVLVAVFDLPDTAPAVGNSVRQIIDPGAFREAIAKIQETVAFLRDHGNAHITGYVDSSLILGYGKDFREGKATVRDRQLSGLLYEAHWNLATPEGSAAFERARFDPFGTRFSFRWGKDTVYRAKDGFEHVQAFDEIVEVSQVGMGAQAAAGILQDTLRAAVEAEVAKVMATVFPVTSTGLIGRVVDETLKDALKEEDQVDQAPVIDGKTIEEGMRAFSVNEFEWRVGAAAEQAVRSDESYGWCREVFTDDGSLTSGWVVMGLVGTYVVDDSDPENLKALSGSWDAPSWYRIAWTGEEPDADGVPTQFAFLVDGARAVTQRWVDEGTPIREGETAPGVIVLDWLESETRVPGPTDGLAQFGKGAEADPTVAAEQAAEVDLDWYATLYATPPPVAP